MSCNSFLKICSSCKNTLAGNGQKEPKKTKDGKTIEEPNKVSKPDQIVWDLFNNIQRKIHGLTLQNKLIYYESIGHILSAINSD